MIIFSNKKNISKPSIILRSTKINQVLSHKHLGSYFAPDMSWSIHIDNCIKKMNKKLGLLRRQSYVLKKIQRIDIYKTMIRPIIEYGAVLTDNCSTSDALKLDKVQRTAALICTGAMRRTETGLLLDFLGWEKLGDRRKLSKMAIFYKIINKTTPEYLSKNLNPIVNSTYSLRSSYSNLIKPYKCRLTKYKNSFFPNCTKLWNALPDAIKISDNLSIFKTRLKIHLGKENNSCILHKLEHFHDGFYGSLLNQIGLKLSPLRAQLFRYNLNDSPSCGIAPETPTHFFLECSKYDDARMTLISNLSKLDPSMADDKNAIIDFIVLGSTQGDKATRTSVNKAIFRHAKIFISSTRRFIIWFALAVFTILICLMILSN